MEFLISKLSGWALSVIDAGGYWGIFVLSALESAAIPIPSEVVVPFSGFLAAQGRFSLMGITLVASLANLIGSVILYSIGVSGGRAILERYGKYILISHHDLEVADRWFSRYGARAVFIGRILPVVRTFISLPAGVARMPFGKFSFYTLLGSLPWNFVLAYAGFKAGENWSYLHGWFRQADILIVSLVVFGIILYLVRHRQRQHG